MSSSMSRPFNLSMKDNCSPCATSLILAVWKQSTTLLVTATEALLPRTSAPRRFSTDPTIRWRGDQCPVMPGVCPTRVPPEQAVALQSERLLPWPLHKCSMVATTFALVVTSLLLMGNRGEPQAQAHQHAQPTGTCVLGTAKRARHLPHPTAVAYPRPLDPLRLHVCLGHSQRQSHDLLVQVKVQMACRGRCLPPRA